VLVGDELHPGPSVPGPIRTRAPWLARRAWVNRVTADRRPCSVSGRARAGRPGELLSQPSGDSFRVVGGLTLEPITAMSGAAAKLGPIPRASEMRCPAPAVIITHARPGLVGVPTRAMSPCRSPACGSDDLCAVTPSDELCASRTEMPTSQGFLGLPSSDSRVLAS
jgi:hypothetical protein